MPGYKMRRSKVRLAIDTAHCVHMSPKLVAGDISHRIQRLSALATVEYLLKSMYELHNVLGPGWDVVPSEAAQ